MYYSKKSSINSDYYNAYGHSNGDKEKPNTLNTIIKLLAVILLLTLIVFGYMFIRKEQNRDQLLVDQTVAVAKDVSPSNAKKHSVIEVNKVSPRTLSNQEILQIVQIVMKQMNQKSKGDSTVQLTDDDSYAKALMHQEVDELQGKTDSFNLQKVDSQKVVQKNLSLQESNHYNKVVIKENKEGGKASDYLAQLSTKLENETSLTTPPSVTYYTQSISKELDVRSNEMRIIIVKKGDTLSRIAHRAYGDYDAYPKILRANPEVIVNPDQIFVGQRLRIPQ